MGRWDLGTEEREPAASQEQNPVLGSPLAALLVSKHSHEFLGGQV